ncbi:MAG: carboxypeptidase-like regulatory domain-containing protein [Bacteroidia bacterium]
MHYTRLLFFIVLSLFSTGLLAQSYTISGYVRVGESGESLIAATVAAPGLKKGTYTNEYGFYSLTLPAGTDSVKIVYSYAGYDRVNKTLLLTEDIVINVELFTASLDAVEIVANSYSEQIKSTEMSIERISVLEAKKIPALFGEVDIIKTLQLKPGISSGSEGTSGIFVRGGGTDQNLVLLDGTTLYNPSHLFGFFSTFNPDAVKDVKLYKGGFPGQYGGRLSSVIDVRMNEGNRKKFSGSGGVGLISSRLTLEGPLVKDKGSFMVAGRRTYVDIFTRLLNDVQEDNPDWNQIPDYFFYDFNAKANYNISDKDQIFLSGYIGRDIFGFSDDNFNFDFRWGNANATLRWNHLFTPKLFLNTSASFSDYEYVISNKFDIFSFELGSKITDGSIKSEFTWLPNNKHTVRFGASTIFHNFTVGRLNAGASDSTFSFGAGEKYRAQEFGVYVGDDWEVSTLLKVNVGLRASGFLHEDGTFYANLEPRASARLLLGENVSIKASYARMVQYLHLVANSGNTLPTDVWYPSNARVSPQGSDQIALGVTFSLGDMFLVSNEVYYKWLQNAIDFKNGANLFVNTDLDSEFVFGRGWAYGNEFYIEKKKGKLTGWVGYTYSWSWRQFDGVDTQGEVVVDNVLNDGKQFHPRNDRRHDVSVVAMYEINKRFTLSASWEYRSGDAITLAYGRFYLFGPDVITIPQTVPDYTERNGFRMPAYHRMDVGLVINFFPKWGNSDLTISAYNAYNRRNPYFIYPEEVTNDDGVTTGFQAQQVALFPVIPSITYNFKF